MNKNRNKNRLPVAVDYNFEIGSGRNMELLLITGRDRRCIPNGDESRNISRTLLEVYPDSFLQT